MPGRRVVSRSFPTKRDVSKTPWVTTKDATTEPRAEQRQPVLRGKRCLRQRAVRRICRARPNKRATSTDETQMFCKNAPSESGTRGLARWLRDARQLFPGGTIGLNGEPPNSAVVTDNNVLVICVRGDRERFSFHTRSLN